jgi:hypothetical protein
MRQRLRLAVNATSLFVPHKNRAARSSRAETKGALGADCMLLAIGLTDYAITLAVFFRRDLPAPQ